MRPTWLIEDGVYREEADRLQEEIRAQGMSVALAPHRALVKGTLPLIDGKPLQPGDCVIGYGTYPFARQIQLHHRWVPGVWCDAINLDCATYYAYFGKFLLNERYVIMPGVEAIRQADWLFATLGQDDVVFVRPTGCQKLFVGRCISREGFAAGLAMTRYDPTTMVVVAPPRPITREWRLVVCQDEIVSGSQYAVAGQRDIAPDLPANVHAFAQRILKEVSWRPDPIFMLDIAESGDRLWLVEINSFSSSWLYQCDIELVVARAARLAETAWRRQSADP